LTLLAHVIRTGLQNVCSKTWRALANGEPPCLIFLEAFFQGTADALLPFGALSGAAGFQEILY
jgi:hypothetical protein